eukprot:COSAG01_NODE_3894_length_5575_cov_746.141136_7_plen_102_part_00
METPAAHPLVEQGPAAAGAVCGVDQRLCNLRVSTLCSQVQGCDVLGPLLLRIRARADQQPSYVRLPTRRGCIESPATPTQRSSELRCSVGVFLAVAGATMQ